MLVDLGWPQHARYLVPGVNDTWNSFQKFNRGRVVRADEWRVAKNALHADFAAYLAKGGIPANLKMFKRWIFFHRRSTLTYLFFSHICHESSNFQDRVSIDARSGCRNL